MTVLAFDVGGTQLRGALCDDAGRPLQRRAVPSPCHDPDALVQALLEQGRELLAAADGAPRAAALAIAGTVDRQAGSVGVSPSLGLHDVQLRAPLEAGLGLPVALVNDVNAAALAEARAVDCADLVALFVGTGVGTGAVSGGRLVQGQRGMAAEGGHFIWRPDGLACPLGCRGCFEAYLGGESLARRARAAGVAEDTAGLLAAARAGDAAAEALVEDARQALAALTTLLVNIFDPQRLVLGGGVARRWPELLDVARAAVAANPLGNGRRELPVEPARLTDDAGLVGAAHAALDLAAAG